MNIKCIYIQEKRENIIARIKNTENFFENIDKNNDNKYIIIYLEENTEFKFWINSDMVK